MDSGSRPGDGTTRQNLVGREFGWNAHAAIQAWTSSVDAKASIVLVVETAVAGASAKSLASSSGFLHGLDGTTGALALVAVCALGVAVILALYTVFPNLKRGELKRFQGTGLIYFGHLRHMPQLEIENALLGLTPAEEVSQLAMQLSATSEVVWRKHARLQASLVVFAISTSLILGLAAFA